MNIFFISYVDIDSCMLCYLRLLPPPLLPLPPRPPLLVAPLRLLLDEREDELTLLLLLRLLLDERDVLTLLLLPLLSLDERDVFTLLLLPRLLLDERDVLTLLFWRLLLLFTVVRLFVVDVLRLLVVCVPSTRLLLLRVLV